MRGNAIESEEAPVNSGKTLFAQLMDFLPWSGLCRQCYW
jgi:hypothetical protein